jgi:hypothetical protein
MTDEVEAWGPNPAMVHACWFLSPTERTICSIGPEVARHKSVVDAWDRERVGIASLCVPWIMSGGAIVWNGAAGQ